VSFAVIVSFIIFPKLILIKKLHLEVVAHKVCEYTAFQCLILHGTLGLGELSMQSTEKNRR
jgi:hypothetical protein